MVKPTETSPPIESTHKTELDWLTSHPGALAAFEDQWVAIAGERVVAHGESMVDVVREAKRQGFDDPLLVPVMPYPWIGD